MLLELYYKQLYFMYIPMQECNCTSKVCNSTCGYRFITNFDYYNHACLVLYVRGQQESYYSGDFIVKNSLVDSHLEKLGYASERVRINYVLLKVACYYMCIVCHMFYVQQSDCSGMCGTTRWKAAKAVSKTMPNLDETGIVIGGCRHVIAQKAANMFRGEMYVGALNYMFIHRVYIPTLYPNRYGYPHYLHQEVFASRGVRWLWEDVICQYWPWARRKSHLFINSRAMEMKPALSVMHAKAHSWHCQVRVVYCVCECVHVCVHGSICIVLCVVWCMCMCAYLYSVCMCSVYCVCNVVYRSYVYVPAVWCKMN